jgi:CheY-like chemotaxis protein
MNRFRVLLMGAKNQLPGNLPDLLNRDSGRELVAEAVEAVSVALARLNEQGYDAAVCWADRTDELAGVIRIRKANPLLPILVLTETGAAGFDDLARQSGSNRTVRAAGKSSGLSECILQAILSGDLRREMLKQIRSLQRRAGDVETLIAENRALVKSAKKLVQKPPATRVPMLVEDDPHHAFLTLRAFHAAGIYAPLPVLKSAEEAIAFLSKEESFRTLDPVQPLSFALFDLALPGMSGLDLLEWMMKAPRFQRVPVIILSSSTDPEPIHRAFQLGAKSYLIKPAGFDALVRLVEGVHRFWSSSDPLLSVY